MLTKLSVSFFLIFYIPQCMCNVALNRLGLYIVLHKNLIAIMLNYVK